MKYVLASIMLTIPATAFAQDAATIGYINSAFAAMDTNKDAKVDRAEFSQFMTARLARQATAFNSAFSALDKNGDGLIDKTEASLNAALLNSFAAVDSDGSGKISKDELRAAMIAAQAEEAGAE